MAQIDKFPQHHPNCQARIGLICTCGGAQADQAVGPGNPERAEPEHRGMEKEYREPEPVTVVNDTTRYCESITCRTVIFLVLRNDKGTLSENCPTCGQFGRKKGQQ